LNCTIQSVVQVHLFIYFPFRLHLLSGFHIGILLSFSYFYSFCCCCLCRTISLLFSVSKFILHHKLRVSGTFSVWISSSAVFAMEYIFLKYNIDPYDSQTNTHTHTLLVNSCVYQYVIHIRNEISNEQKGIRQIYF
jgi:SNF family Na+-dependent transporter